MDGWNGERQKGTTFAQIEPKHIERYEIASQYIDGKKVLDAACGCGYGTNLLAQNGAKEVLGVDNSLEALLYAHEWWDFPNVIFKHFNLNEPDFTELGIFDTIVSFETIEHLRPDPINTLEKFDEILKPGGYLVFSHPENEKAPGGKYHFHTGLKGNEIIKHMQQYNYEVVFDWLQPSRRRVFKLPYHVVVLTKCKL